MEMKVATKHDLPLVAECHILAFPETSSAQLGPKFVAAATPECFVTDPTKFLLFILRYTTRAEPSGVLNR